MKMIMDKFITILVIFASLMAVSMPVGADVFRGNMLKEDITLQSGVDITALGGASNLDFGLSTGTITARNLVVTNAATIGGLIVSGVISNATYIANTLNVRDTTALNATTATTLRTSGVANFVGAVTTTTTAKVGGTITGANLVSNGTLSVGTTSNLVGAVTTTGAAKVGGAATLNSLGVNTTSNFVGAITATSTEKIGGTATLNAGVINTTLDVNGATTALAITTDAGYIITSDQFNRRATTSATNFTITDTGPDLYLVGNGTGVNKQTILLPTVGDNKGRVITIIEAVDPGTNTIVIDGEGGETVDGAATKTTTDAVGSMYHLISNGVTWIKIVSSGTWT